MTIYFEVDSEWADLDGYWYATVLSGKIKGEAVKYPAVVLRYKELPFFISNYGRFDEATGNCHATLFTEYRDAVDFCHENAEKTT